MNNRSKHLMKDNEFFSQTGSLSQPFNTQRSSEVEDFAPKINSHMLQPKSQISESDKHSVHMSIKSPKVDGRRMMPSKLFTSRRKH